MRTLLLTVFSFAAVALAEEPKATGTTANGGEKALIIQNGKGAQGGDQALIIQNGKEPAATKKAPLTESAKNKKLKVK
jgi:hypothetical protein